MVGLMELCIAAGNEVERLSMGGVGQRRQARWRFSFSRCVSEEAAASSTQAQEKQTYWLKT